MTKSDLVEEVVKVAGVSKKHAEIIVNTVFASIVNALQRHATIVVQKSLKEGFGLTVTEAMWKEKPVVASALGGILDQIEDGKSGILLEDPTDTGAFANVLAELLASPERRNALGAAAAERVRDRFLGVDHLIKYARLVERLDENGPQS